MTDLDRDGRLLFLTRALRMAAYGFLSVVLVLHLAALGFGQGRIGLLLTLTLAGDTLISLLLTTRADRWGRRRTLAGGALLMAGAGAAFALSGDFWVLLAAATLGVLSPSGNEVGPFLAIEQASLAQVLPGQRRTAVFAWYNLAGSFATALGALAGGWTAQFLQAGGMAPVASYRVLILAYGACGLLLAGLFRRVSPAVEAPPAEVPRGGLGLGRSRGTVLRLSALFSLDAFAGGFVIQSLVAWWFHARFGVPPGVLGSIFFGANLLAGISALLAARIADRIGLLNTMVCTHIPSNVLLILVPLMPTLPLAVAVLLLRFSISQMDVPTRQSYTMAVVDPAERSAAAGVTGIARTTGASVAPVLAGQLMASPALGGFAFILSGSLKIVYDLLLWRSFRRSQEGGSGR
ncbi:MFS transporter [Mesoterricola sediminis]|uniref:ABC transporter permease n=1 Tax=Mesoterricola sediminis TaxID=2927980 RepID=A0AA48GQ79_9BACT|nr:MFS transporter [Mesoterricola sediminis]BDU75564.1 ABC transporter permease [Mesoterricola sediminis]